MRIATSIASVATIGRRRSKRGADGRWPEKVHRRVQEAHESRDHAPLFGYKVSYRRLLELHARLLSRYLLGEIDEYPNFTTR